MLSIASSTLIKRLSSAGSCDVMVHAIPSPAQVKALLELNNDSCYNLDFMAEESQESPDQKMHTLEFDFKVTEDDFDSF